MRYDPRRIGEKIHERRRRKGLSIEQLAKQVGTGLPTISKIERGQRPRVSFDLIVRIADELGLSLDELVDEAELQHA
jgi:transcriptional regulator with XRE-family HTH domain